MTLDEKIKEIGAILRSADHLRYCEYGDARDDLEFLLAVVRDMKKTLDHYADERTYDLDEFRYLQARACLKKWEGE